MIDSYLWGNVERISPEAPVPVVAVTKKEMRPGGAANVAFNIRAMGARPVLCTVIGKDANAGTFVQIMKKFNMPVNGIYKSRECSTTVKTRVIGNNHQLVRVDEEECTGLSDAETAAFISFIKKIISAEQPQVIIFEDYDKGVLNKKVIHAVIEIARRKKIPVAVDPKKKNFLFYKNVSLFKPNLKELRDGLKADLEKVDKKIISRHIKPFRKKQGIGMLMVTLSESGIYFSSNGQDEIIPAHIRNVSDVSGAGDTVISVAALCVALGLSPFITASLANLAGGQVCEKVGVVPVDKKQLLAEAVRSRLI